MVVDVLNVEILLREREGDLQGVPRIRWTPFISPPEPENCQTSVPLSTPNILKHQTRLASLLCAQAGCFGELIEF